jgi:hypothetical protein
LDTVARSEIVEKELDAMIRRRDERRRQSEGERRESELWMEMVKAYDAR